MRNASLWWHGVTISLLLRHIILVCELLLLIDNVLRKAVTWMHVWLLLWDDGAWLLRRKVLWGLVFW